jgi:hypothetical protein
VAQKHQPVDFDQNTNAVTPCFSESYIWRNTCFLAFVEDDMKRFQRIRYSVVASVVMFAFSGLGFAQAPPPQPEPQTAPQQAPPTDSSGWKPIGDNNSSAPTDQPPPPAQNSAQPPATIPPQLTLRPGTYVTVRVDQLLSSDRNHVGDAFAATLVRPIMVDGWVIAERGQTLGGRVSEVKKGRAGSVSRLGVQLTDIPLSDGQQVPVQTQLISQQSPSAAGRNAAAIAGTTAFGAAVGAAAAWGTGAAIGAGAGFVAATLGVLLSHGYPSVIPPESVLTFRIEQPVTISTAAAPQTFRPVEPSDYQQAPAPQLMTRGPGYPPRPPVAPAYFYGPGYYPYYYPYPYYWGPAFYGGFFFGPRVFIGRRW